ncbi:caspase domain-containing protein [Russula vinacea]|nr:caspase domain-containing protein [Russula vinacea]
MPDDYGYSRSGPPPSPPASFPEPSYSPDQDYDDAQGGTTYSTSGDTYPPWPEPGVPVRYQAPQQSPPLLPFPASPQEIFDWTGQRVFHPQMPIPRPFIRYTGKKRALIIGINYSLHPRLDLELRKCIDDAYGMANFLHTELGFSHNDVRIMTNESPWDCPTEENIRRAMEALVFDAKPHDSLVFYFSGHALQAKDMSGYDTNGLAECSLLCLVGGMSVTNGISVGICAMDYRGDDPYPLSNTPGLVADNVMHKLMVQPLPQHCRLTAIYDSCHSATLLGLPHLIAPSHLTYSAQYDSNGMAKPIRHPERLRILRQQGSYADIVSLSASKDEEEALETERGGALRWAFIKTVRKFNNTLTYKELLWSVRDYMRKHGFPQRPQIQLTLREDRFQEIRMELGHVWVTCVGGSRRLRPAPIKGVMGRRALRLVMAGQLS